MRKKILLVLFILSFGGLFFIIGSCSDDRKMVNLALKEEGKVYLVPLMAKKEMLEPQLSRNKTPEVSKSLQLIQDHGDLFIEPRNLKNMVNLIANNYTLYGKNEGTYNGYVVFEHQEAFEYTVNNVNTDKIGEQLKQETIRIKGENSGKILEIVWSSSPKPKVEKNCVVKRLWVVEHPYPGKSVGDYQNAVVVNLNEVINFFDNGTRLEYDEDGENLYVIK